MGGEDEEELRAQPPSYARGAPPILPPPIAPREALRVRRGARPLAGRLQRLEARTRNGRASDEVRVLDGGRGDARLGGDDGAPEREGAAHGCEDDEGRRREESEPRRKGQRAVGVGGRGGGGAGGRRRAHHGDARGVDEDADEVDGRQEDDNGGDDEGEGEPHTAHDALVQRALAVIVAAFALGAVAEQREAEKALRDEELQEAGSAG